MKRLMGIVAAGLITGVLVVPAQRASAAPLAFTDCSGGNSRMVISSIDVTPQPLVKGHRATLRVDGALEENVTDGQYSVTLSYLGIPLVTQSGSLGDVAPLPWTAGPFSASAASKVPKIAPSGDYSVQVSATDQYGQTLVCVAADLEVA